jgi:hypothetical protein
VVVVGTLVKATSRIVAGGMLREGTPLEDYRRQWGLSVKREDKACTPPGPYFSKSRGVYARVSSREEEIIGVLDTRHSQAGFCVARACEILGKCCINYYPDFKHEPGPRQPQLEAVAVGAVLKPLPAGRSAVLYHAARKDIEARGGYMMPNALKLEESVEETAKEVERTSGRYDWVLVSASSGTIAAGVIRGYVRSSMQQGIAAPQFIVHLGYSRSHKEVEKYLVEASGYCDFRVAIVDEGYAYKDEARAGSSPDWPCNVYYDLKAFRWWADGSGRGASYPGRVLFWNIG